MVKESARRLKKKGLGIAPKPFGVAAWRGACPLAVYDLPRMAASD
jgi:hypothetical protein